MGTTTLYIGNSNQILTCCCPPAPMMMILDRWICPRNVQGTCVSPDWQWRRNPPCTGHAHKPRVIWACAMSTMHSKPVGRGWMCFLETCWDRCHSNNLFLSTNISYGPQDMRTNPLCSEHARGGQCTQCTSCTRWPRARAFPIVLFGWRAASIAMHTWNVSTTYMDR